MLKYLRNFQNASSETKQFVITVGTFLLIIIGGLIFALGRLDFDRSYEKSAPPPSKTVRQ